jgi:isocitrate/isopropylmalate dehydrogenase
MRAMSAMAVAVRQILRGAVDSAIEAELRGRKAALAEIRQALQEYQKIRPWQAQQK